MNQPLFALEAIVDIVVEGTQPPAFPAAICYPYVDWLSAVIEEPLIPSIEPACRASIPSSEGTNIFMHIHTCWRHAMKMLSTLLHFMRDSTVTKSHKRQIMRIFTCLYLFSGQTGRCVNNQSCKQPVPWTCLVARSPECKSHPGRW